MFALCGNWAMWIWAVSNSMASRACNNPFVIFKQGIHCIEINGYVFVVLTQGCMEKLVPIFRLLLSVDSNKSYSAINRTISALGRYSSNKLFTSINVQYLKILFESSSGHGNAMSGSSPILNPMFFLGQILNQKCFVLTSESWYFILEATQVPLLCVFFLNVLTPSTFRSADSYHLKP